VNGCAYDLLMNWRVVSALIVMLAPNLLRAGEPPVSIFLADRTVEYLPGTLPLIIAAPHGGQLEPEDIPDREDGVTTRDAETDLLAVELAESIARRTGARPHLILCHLHRKKVDCNRDALTGTGGNPKALATWRAFHEAIGKARAAAGHGLFLDLHGHSHPIARVEIGYLLSAEQLQETGTAFETLAPASGLAKLAARGRGSFDELLRGPESLGGLLESAGYAAVPSPKAPHPGEEPYFRGGYNTARYRTGGTGDGFFSLQVECPRPGVRDTPENRRRFAETFAAVLERWMERQAGIRLRKPGGGVVKGGSE
jgi:hypothetical protein